MTRRRLRPDELELWQQIARSADPLHKHRKPLQTAQPVTAPVVRRESPAAPPIPPFTLGDRARPRDHAATLPSSAPDRLRNAPAAMDAKALARLKRGKLSPEARIDLHGMTLDQAHPELVRFILTAQTRGLRLVLVITGKGGRDDPYDPLPRRRGVLKSQVPLWLGMAPVAQAVLQVLPAHQSHGGEGAYYVYLKRRR